MRARLGGPRRGQVGILVAVALVVWAALAGTTGAATTTTTTDSSTTTLGCMAGPDLAIPSSPLVPGQSIGLIGVRFNTDATGAAPCWGPYSGPVHLALTVGARTSNLGDVTSTNGTFRTTVEVPADTPAGHGGINATWDAGGLGVLTVSVGVTVEELVPPTTSGLPAPVPGEPTFTG
jgi:hypothetical protein